MGCFKGNKGKSDKWRGCSKDKGMCVPCISDMIKTMLNTTQQYEIFYIS